jgi:hypothetical protein
MALVDGIVPVVDEGGRKRVLIKCDRFPACLTRRGGLLYKFESSLRPATGNDDLHCFLSSLLLLLLLLYPWYPPLDSNDHVDTQDALSVSTIVLQCRTKCPRRPGGCQSGRGLRTARRQQYESGHAAAFALCTAGTANEILGPSCTQRRRFFIRCRAESDECPFVAARDTTLALLPAACLALE